MITFDKILLAVLAGLLLGTIVYAIVSDIRDIKKAKTKEEAKIEFWEKNCPEKGVVVQYSFSSGTHNTYYYIAITPVDNPNWVFEFEITLADYKKVPVGSVVEVEDDWEPSDCWEPCLIEDTEYKVCPY